MMVLVLRQLLNSSDRLNHKPSTLILGYNLSCYISSTKKPQILLGSPRFMAGCLVTIQSYDPKSSIVVVTGLPVTPNLTISELAE